MIIACITDRRFAQLCGVLLASLDDRGDAADCPVVVFSVKLRERDKQNLRLSFGASERLTFIDIDPSTPPLKQLLPTRWTLGPANYARLFIPTILNGKDDRLLYLDCDMIVTSSLGPLKDVDLQGNIAAAVPESDQGLHPSVDDRLDDLPADIPYFNAGMMLVDIERWNRENFTKQVFDFILTHQGELRFPTQDPLNCVIRGRYRQLDRAWNFIFRRETDRDCEGARIIHFAGSKPWSSEYAHPARELFEHYRSLTPWRDSRLESRFERRMRKIAGKRIIRLKRLWLRLTAPMSR